MQESEDREKGFVGSANKTAMIRLHVSPVNYINRSSEEVALSDALGII